MSEKTSPTSVRFRKPLRGKIRAASKRLNLNQSATIELAVERGLPLVLSALVGGMAQSKSVTA